MCRSISFFEVEPSSRKPMIDINGMADVILTVSRYDKTPAFYARLMPAMVLDTVSDNDGLTYFVAARTAVGRSVVTVPSLWCGISFFGPARNR